MATEPIGMIWSRHQAATRPQPQLLQAERDKLGKEPPNLGSPAVPTQCPIPAYPQPCWGADGMGTGHLSPLLGWRDYNVNSGGKEKPEGAKKTPACWVDTK